ncbi:MAG TPA: cytochrome b [Paraburkholderia sp.]|jgi:cytochrome b561
MTTVHAQPASPVDTPRIARYTPLQITLHWLIALGIVTMLALGLYMTSLPPKLPLKSVLTNLHKSLGLTVFLLVLIRIAARAARNAPPLPPMRPWQRAAAHTTQGLLYVGMVVMPVTGYLGSSFNRFGTRFWGIPLPKWGWDDAHLRGIFFGIHQVIAWTMIALIVLHVLGALKHQFIDRDHLFARMWR